MPFATCEEFLASLPAAAGWGGGWATLRLSPPPTPHGGTPGCLGLCEACLGAADVALARLRLGLGSGRDGVGRVGYCRREPPPRGPLPHPWETSGKAPSSLVCVPCVCARVIAERIPSAVLAVRAGAVCRRGRVVAGLGPPNATVSVWSGLTQSGGALHAHPVLCHLSPSRIKRLACSLRLG